MEYKPALLVLFATLVVSEPINYRSPAIQNTSPQIPIIPLDHRVEYNLTPANTEPLAVEAPPKPYAPECEAPVYIGNQPNLPPPPPPPPLPSRPPFSYSPPKPEYIPLPSSTPAPPPQPSYISFPSSTYAPPSLPPQPAFSYPSPQPEYIPFSSSTSAPPPPPPPSPPPLPPRPPFKIEVYEPSHYHPSSPPKAECVETAPIPFILHPPPHYEAPAPPSLPPPPSHPPYYEAPATPPSLPPPPPPVPSHYPLPQYVATGPAHSSPPPSQLPPTQTQYCDDQGNGAILLRAPPLYPLPAGSVFPSKDSIAVESASQFYPPPPPPPVPSQSFSQFYPSHSPPSAQPIYQAYPSPSPPPPPPPPPTLLIDSDLPSPSTPSPSHPPQLLFSGFTSSPPSHPLPPAGSDCVVYEPHQKSPLYVPFLPANDPFPFSAIPLKDFVSE